MEFLKANGIEDPGLMKEIDYQDVLNQQEIYGEELNLFANKEMHKEVGQIEDEQKILIIQYQCLYIIRVKKAKIRHHEERSGSVVECLTRDREAAGSSLTGVTALWSLSKTHLS